MNTILILIIAGLLLDLIEFIVRLKQHISKKKVMSATPLIGLLLVISGIIGLKIYGYSWLICFIFFLLAIVIHLSLQILLPFIIGKYNTGK